MLKSRVPGPNPISLNLGEKPNKTVNKVLENKVENKDKVQKNITKYSNS